MSYMRVS